MHDFSIKYGPWGLVAGASEGLGAAFAEALARRGLSLILIARRLDKLEALAADLRKKYAVEVRTFSVDLSDLAASRAFLAGLEVAPGLLVYNAAYAPIGYFEDLPEADLQKIATVNVQGPLLFSKILSEKMLERGRGGIVLMSSLSGAQGSPKIATYAATKAFNTILAEGLWSEWRDRGVDVIASCAGAIRTPGYEKAKDQKEAPGTLDAMQVAEETLDALGKGPVVVPGRINKFFRFLMGRMLPRKTAISIMKNNTKNLSQ
jgi:short-subunit dehydrogenase